MLASWSKSITRVVRSLFVVVIISSTIFSIVSASLSMAPVSGQQPNVRKRILRISILSLYFSGKRSSSGIISCPSMFTTGLSFAKYSGTIGIFSSRMYCHISSSVQLLRGNTRMLSPFLIRALYMSHSSGRWFLGSHWWNSFLKENIRSLARDFSSSRLAPPNAASNLYLSKALSNCFPQ